jgi:hypothetical protein
VRPDGSPARLQEALAAGWAEVALYLGAGVAYVAIGVAFPEFLFTWIVAAGYLVLCASVVPALARRLR